MGPAALFKLIGLGYFSFTLFGYSQILADLEPLIRILRNDDIVHGHSHTYVGAFVIGILATVSGKYLCEFGLRFWNIIFQFKAMMVPTEISWTVASISAFIGTFSHVLIDSVMHADMNPLWPFSESNEMLYVVSVSTLHLVCVALGLVGVVGLFGVWIWKKILIDVHPRS